MSTFQKTEIDAQMGELLREDSWGFPMKWDRLTQPYSYWAWCPWQLGDVDDETALLEHPDPDAIENGITVIESDRMALPRFLRLADSTPQAVLRFSQKYGALKFCKSHGIPDSHAPIGTFSGPCEFQPWEKTASIQEYARKAAALVRVVAALRQGRPGARRDIALLWAPGKLIDGYEQILTRLKWWDGPEYGDLRRYPQDMDKQWRIVSRFVNTWVDYAQLRPFFDFGPGAGLQVEIRNYDTLGIFGVLVRDLSILLSRADGLIMCSGCGLPFMPKRKPAKGRRAWCDRCREDGTMWKITKREQRAR